MSACVAYCNYSATVQTRVWCTATSSELHACDTWWLRHPAIRAQKVSAGASVGMKVLKEAHLFDDWEITPRDFDMYLKRFARCGRVKLQ